MKVVNGFEVPENIDEPGDIVNWRDAKLQRKITALSSTLEGMANGLFPTINIGAESNNFSVDANGNFILEGEAAQWKTMTTEGSATKLGSQDKPDFDYTNIGILFPQDDPTEKILIVGALQDDYKEGSSPCIVVYFVQDSAQVPTWKVDFRLNRPGYAIGGWTTLTNSTVKYTYPGTPIMQISQFADIDPAPFLVGDEFDARLYRDDDVVTGDVLFKRISVYYQTDSLGSKDKFVKYPT